jgi:RNA polymerase sigma factor (sigma-70 family)
MITNEEYLKLIEKGDRKSLSKLYEETKKMLSAYMIKTKRYNEDVLSNALVNIITKIDRYDPDICQFNTWCISILKNEVLYDYKTKTHWKRDYRLKTHIDSEDVFIQLANQEIEEYDLNIEKYAELMKKTILDNDFIELYNFLYTKKKQQEIADDMGMNINTYKSRVRKQKELIIKKMKNGPKH